MIQDWQQYTAFILLIFITVGAFAASQLISIEIISLPFLTIFVVSFLFLLYLAAIKFVPRRDIKLSHPKAVDVIIFLLVTMSAIVGRLAESGVLDWYYPLVIVTTSVLAFRLATPPVKPRLQLVQILFLALVVRAIPWFSYPVYGQDRFHHTAVEYIIATGEIVPRSVTYYADFPDAHRFAASYTLITGAPFKTGYFSLGIVVALSILGVYLLANYVLEDERGALIAALFVSVSGYHIYAGSEPFAQALFTGLVPFIFYLLIRQDNDWRRVLLLLGLAGFAAKIQNIAPLVLIGVSVAFLISGAVTRKSISLSPKQNLVKTFSVSISVVAVVFVVGVYNYILTGYLRLQTFRIVWFTQSLFGSSGSAGQNPTSPTGVSGVPTVSLFGHELPGVLMWAVPILTGAGILLLTVYLILYALLQDRREFEQIQFIGGAALIFAIFAVFFIAGSPATRALPSVIVLLSPVVGWTIYKTGKEQPTMGQVFAVIVILSTVTAGVLAPPVAKAELGDDDFRAWMDSEEVAATEFAVEHTKSAQASDYAAGHEAHIRYSRPNGASNLILEPTLNKKNTSTIQQYESGATAGKTTVYFNHFETVYDIPEPSTNKVYSSGEASILT